MEPLPPFRPKHLAECLMGSFSLSRLALTDNQAAFADNLHLTILAAAYGDLIEFDQALSPYYEAEENDKN